MIYLLTMMLIIDLVQSQIEVDLSEEDTWTTILDTSQTITFKVTSVPAEYCYVRIELYSKDPTFLVMADYKGKPNSKFISTYKQGEKIDRISQLENRGTRFLKLKGQTGTIYITTMADYKNNEYQITITGNNKEQCDNECYKNGICEAEGCVCDSSFIGNDCHQQTEDLFSESSKDVDFLNNETIKFFSIDLQNLFGQTLKLEFESDCQGCLTIIIYKTKALLMPYEAQNSNYTQLFSISDGYSIIQTQIPDQLPVSQQILYFAVFRQCSYCEFTHLQIRFNQNPKSIDNENQDSSKLIYIIIPSVFGSLIFFLIIGCLLRRRRNSMNQATSVAQDPFYQQPRNGIPQDPFYHQNINVIPQDPFYQQNRNVIPQDPFYQQNRSAMIQDPLQQQPQREIVQYPASQFVWQKEEGNNDENEKCIICFLQLNNYNHQILKLRCGHQFHRDCIKKQDQQSDCPYCRQPMDLNEIY